MWRLERADRPAYRMTTVNVMAVAGFSRVLVVRRVTLHVPIFFPALIIPLGVTEHAPFAFHDTFVFRSVGAGSTFEPAIDRLRPI